MPQTFTRKSNGIASMVLWGLVAAAVVIVAVAIAVPRSEWLLGMDRMPTQPVPFSHLHHAGTLGIDCRYCHTGVETSAFAGLPPTETCMTCHSQIWTGAAMLAPVRQSMIANRPMKWRRVNDLPDYVYFNHAAHVRNGVGCETCHGNVARMPLMRQAAPLTMSWCLDCHRDPEPNLRPLAAVTTMGWTPPPDIAAVRADLMRRHRIHPETMEDCYVCHR